MGGALELGAKWFWDSCSLYILSLWTLHVHFAHGHIRVYGYATLCDTLKAALVEKLLFFRFAKKMFQYRFYGLYNSFYQPIRLRVKCWCFIRFTPYFSNHNLRSSSQNFGALSDTRVFGMPFLENMTLTVCFIIELFLFGKQITSGQSEKESTSINTSPIPVMYAWYIYTRLDGSSCLGHKCKVVCVKFLNSLYFLHPFIYSSTSWEYPGHHASNFILFVWPPPHMYAFYHQLSLCFWGNYQITIANQSIFYR